MIDASVGVTETVDGLGPGVKVSSFCTAGKRALVQHTDHPVGLLLDALSSAVKAAVALAAVASYVFVSHLIFHRHLLALDLQRARLNYLWF
jgi:hypothetical protein